MLLALHPKSIWNGQKRESKKEARDCLFFSAGALVLGRAISLSLVSERRLFLFPSWKGDGKSERPVLLLPPLAISMDRERGKENWSYDRWIVDDARGRVELALFSRRRQGALSTFRWSPRQSSLCHFEGSFFFQTFISLPLSCFSFSSPV